MVAKAMLFGLHRVEGNAYVNEERIWGEEEMDNRTGLQVPCPGLRLIFHQENNRCAQSISG